MSRILHIARREWLEQTRQPVMLAVVLTLFTLVAAIVLAGLLLLDHVASQPALMEGLGHTLGERVDPAVAVEGMAGLLISGYNFLIFTQFLGIAAVLSGHSVLHDRQCGTLTFLLLAPVKRIELLIGKVVGAMGPAFAMYLVVSGGASIVASLPAVSEPYGDYLPGNPAWWIAFLLGGPLWAVFVSTICTIVSSVAHDVRTAQQGVWFVVFFGTMVCGFLMTYTLPSGVAAQIAVAALAAFGAAAAMGVGSLVIQRDLGR